MKLPLNSKGRDFFVGDLHGCLHQLEVAMACRNFDREKDRMISVGDLIDRGPQSQKTLQLLAQPWFYAVMGNHEDMMLRGARKEENWFLIWMDNGGDWWNHLTPPEQNYCCQIVREKMPRKIIVDTEYGHIGIIHADVFDHWPDWNDQTEEYGEPAAIWGRKRWYAKDETPVTGVEAVVVGHTPVDQVLQLGNVWYIDTGACFPDGHLTVIEAKEILNEA